MILLYTLLLLVLRMARFLIGGRVATLERKYARAATAADQFLRGPLHREGNSNRPDPYQAAKQQYLLGSLVQKRDRLEAKHEAWQALAEKSGKLVASVENWKGRKLPYTFGVLDVSFLLCLIDYLGVGDCVSLRHLLQVVTACFTR